jgi:hypothetical protein
MTKGELIEALKDFPDDMVIKCNMSFDWGDEDFLIDTVEYDYPYVDGVFETNKKWISLRCYL